MQIIYKPTFEFNLLHIIDFIAIDNPRASVNFANELETPIFHIRIDNQFIFMMKILEIWFLKDILLFIK